ncbi:TRAFAC clade GTPase domain-containing protein [Leadbettera azotonutricia]|uniref:Double-GTPase 2 domain-containing protein n=1 Tax=Leadbettera azotonutricia (strain ATCC BAA-888 / DSM 13862 / ZAS-9) TaxID=545695 RepID=F5Y7K0_LEAAZ|nr:hypothetical protein [Leadbettera azotonutricia]AEF82843.1 conserved hypothetical protein [Leadbettera azotonutricia ZAS-9]
MKIICPYCFGSIDKDDLLYQCGSCGHNSKPTLIERATKKVTCKECGKLAFKILCPKCEGELPRDMIYTPNLLFSIVGVSGAGKTNYITVMLEELRKTANLQLSIAPQNKYTRETHSANRQLIYEEHKKPGSTRSGQPTPQIWRIQNLNRQAFNTIKTYTFSIFDGAGEDHENIDENSPECRYISVSKAIMVVIDPMILQSVRNSLDKEVYEKSISGVGASMYKDSSDVVHNIASYIKSSRGLRFNQKINVPVAVVFTKMDALMHEFRNRPVSSPSPHIDYFHESDSRAVDNDIRSWMQDKGETAFINGLEANFNEFVFFGVSSFGAVPVSIDQLSPIHPHRVLDPALWLFAKNKFIDSK